MSNQWLENQMLNNAAETFGKYRSIEYIILNKVKNKKLFEFFFISKDMTIDQEEKLIDIEIDFEEKYPEYYFDFMVLRRSKTESKHVITELKNRGKERICIFINGNRVIKVQKHE